MYNEETKVDRINNSLRVNKRLVQSLEVNRKSIEAPVKKIGNFRIKISPAEGINYEINQSDADRITIAFKPKNSISIVSDSALEELIKINDCIQYLKSELAEYQCNRRFTYCRKNQILAILGHIKQLKLYIYQLEQELKNNDF